MSEKLTAEIKAGADTRGRLLCAAERLLIERGYAGMSARAVAESAQVNIASASYHFGSKHGVLEAVVQWRLAPMNAARMTQLDVVLANPSHTVEDILYAFLWPLFGAFLLLAAVGVLFEREKELFHETLLLFLPTPSSSAIFRVLKLVHSKP